MKSKRFYIKKKTGGGRSIYILTRTKIPIRPLDMDDWTRSQVGWRHGSRPPAILVMSNRPEGKIH
jgi:hypothetical protein